MGFGLERNLPHYLPEELTPEGVASITRFNAILRESGEQLTVTLDSIEDAVIAADAEAA